MPPITVELFTVAAEIRVKCYTSSGCRVEHSTADTICQEQKNLPTTLCEVDQQEPETRVLPLHVRTVRLEWDGRRVIAFRPSWLKLSIRCDNTMLSSPRWQSAFVMLLLLLLLSLINRHHVNLHASVYTDCIALRCCCDSHYAAVDAHVVLAHTHTTYPAQTTRTKALSCIQFTALCGRHTRVQKARKLWSLLSIKRTQA